MESDGKRLWKGRTDGSPLMLRMLVVLLRHVDVRAVYPVAACVVPFYMIFNRRGCRASYSLFRVRLGMRPWKSFCMSWLNHYRFAQVIVDRFAMYAGKRFRMEMDGYGEFDSLNGSDRGFMIINSHVGSFELAGYTLPSDRKRINALVFGGETESVMMHRENMFSRTNIRLIPISSDISYLFTLSTALAGGEIVTMSGDRCIPGSRTIRCSFLGQEAEFPLGPYALAVSREVQVLAMFVIKVSAKEYRLLVRKVQPQESTGGAGRQADLARAFVSILEETVRKYPEQWFNFYDFWKS